MLSLPSKIKIKDIAAMAGVSAGTVDRVIHNRGDVSAANREKVEKILMEINYTPNIYASALASKKTFLFLAVIPSYNKGDYWEKVIEGIHRAAEELINFRAEVQIRYFEQYNIASFCKVVEEVLKEKPDGILLSPSLKSVTFEYACKMDEMRIPYIFIDSRVEDTHPLAYYGQHSYLSGCLAGRLLLTEKPGMEEIAVFSFYHLGQVPSNQISQRMAGFVSHIMEKKASCHLHRITLDIHDPKKNEQAMHDVFTGNPAIEGAVIFSSRAYVVAEFLKKYQLNHITLIGYDLLDRNIASLRNNSIAYLIAQRPEVQGYRAVKALGDHLIFKKKVEAVNYMPLDILINKNIDFYLGFTNF
ncbi:MAG: LacI family DNA-binding transcriptional regulator [Dysgonamonadaceae bacterium]|jgi:LacI family transcriptional regulator|nr:LacI family DNA-binding transcriptional regulator [Dysgonamonadaceae bacterium]